MNSGLRAKGLFARYRQNIAELGRPRPKLDKFAYMSRSPSPIHRRKRSSASTIRGYLRTTTIVGKGLANPPGYAAAAINADLLANPQKGKLGIIDRDQSR